MARPARLSLAGEMHYVVQTGHNRQAVFADDADRAAYIAMLRDAARQCSVAVHAYSLLDTEVHLLLTPHEAGGIGRMLQSLGRRYVGAFNRRHGRVGGLWSGRFRCGLIDGGSLGLAAIAQVETLPVLAGLVARAAEWPWSSAAHHVGRVRDPMIGEHPAYWTLGNTPFERELAHAHALEVGVGDAVRHQLTEAVSKGRAAGSATFLQRVWRTTGAPPTRPPRGRPRKQSKVRDSVPI